MVKQDIFTTWCMPKENIRSLFVHRQEDMEFGSYLPPYLRTPLGHGTMNSVPKWFLEKELTVREFPKKSISTAHHGYVEFSFD